MGSSDMSHFVGEIILLLSVLGFIGFAAVKLSDPKGKCSPKQQRLNGTVKRK